MQNVFIFSVSIAISAIDFFIDWLLLSKSFIIIDFKYRYFEIWISAYKNILDNIEYY